MTDKLYGGGGEVGRMVRVSFNNPNNKKKTMRTSLFVFIRIEK